MPGRDVVLIGASAGGIEALRQLLGGLPAGLPAAVLIVVHTPAGPPGALPGVLARCGPLPAAYAVPGQRLTPGLLTVAPPGHHLVVTPGDTLRLHRGPAVHRTRPAFDPLLHSAARVCAGRVVAVVLSGRLSDGADGAAAVAAAGGAVLVQDPAEAQSPGMPGATLERVREAAAWPAAKLGAAIADLVGAPARPAPRRPLRVHGDVDELDDALWTAVSCLQAHADAQQQLARRLGAAGPVAEQCRSRAARVQRAAEVIEEHVMPLFEP